MRCRSDSVLPLPSVLFTCIILLVTFPYFFFSQASYSKNLILNKANKALVDSIYNHSQVKTYIRNLPVHAARLPIDGYVSELGISPNEEVWLATRAGSTYYTKAVGELWHLEPFRSKDEPSNQSGETYERVSFFSEDTLMISGFIQGDNSVANFVYWSGDHGKSWRKVKFGESSWIDAAFINNKGKAWMSGSSQYIYYSKDNGLTWEQKHQVEPNTNLRFSTIHFANDEQTGLFGSHWNVIYLTKDNCNTWTKLPTPLVQHKYQKISSQEAPDIRKVRILGNYYLVNQEGRIFYSTRDKIDWQPMPEIIDFEVTENGFVYLLNKDLTIAFRSSNLTPVWRSADKLDGAPIVIAVRNNNLFVKTYDFIYKINKGEFTASSMLTTEVPIQEPYLKVKFKGEDIGFDRKDIVRWNKKKKYWYRAKTLTFEVGNAVRFDNHLIVSDYSLKNHYTFDPDSNKLKSYELPPTLFNFAQNQVKSFSIEKGSQGCFHLEKSNRTYVRRGDFFVLAQNKKFKDLFKDIPGKLPAQTIFELLQTINKSHNKKLGVADLQITEKDIASFNSFITQKEKEIKQNGSNRFGRDEYYEFPEENTDFSFYRSVVSSINSIPDSVIDQIFRTGYGNHSTTTDWLRFNFEFQNGQKLSISNRDDLPNYLYAPWIIDFEGLLLKTNSLNLGRQLNEITGGEFYNATAKEKKYALFQIANHLYRESIKYP